MDFKTLFAVLLVSLLIFGCASPQSGGQQGPAGPVVTPPAQPPATLPGNESAQPPLNPTPAANGSGGDLIGKTFEQLVGLGVPIKCDITTSSGTATLYKEPAAT